LTIEQSFISFAGPLPPDQYLERLKALGGEQLMMTAIEMSVRAQEHAHRMQLAQLENSRESEKDELPSAARY